MAWPDASSLALFLAVVAFVAGAFVAGVAASAPAGAKLLHGAVAAVAVVAWMASAMILAPWFQSPEPATRLAPYLLLNLALGVGLAASPVGRRLATLPLGALVGVQAFRLPLEVVLHQWADQGVVPVAMSWSGQNLDVVTGLAALALAPFAGRSRAAVWAFQALGLGLLANIARIVAQHTVGSPLYAPTGGPPLELVLYTPTTWIVSVCVLGAFVAHGVTLRALVTRQR